MDKKNRKKGKTAVIIIAAVIILGVGAVIWYINDYYRSENVSKYLTSTSAVDISKIKEGYYFDGTGEDTAMIFYPGAKVEATAYAPLLYRLSAEGVDCFLVEMPGNLAIFGQNRADLILQEHDYENWYMAGHSLGGAMAASYASEHTDNIKGLILLAAYPTKSLKAEGFSALTLFGSNDLVLNREKIQSGKQFMPENYTEICIEGGNHAWFGNYGVQKGDGKADISREEQQEQAAEAIQSMVEQTE